MTSFGFGRTQGEETIKTRTVARPAVGCDLTEGEISAGFVMTITICHGTDFYNEFKYMHELSIASSILDVVAKEAKTRPGAHILKVGLRIGELAGVDRDALSFGWEVLTKDTEWDGLRLEIEDVPRRQRCSVCAHEFAAPDFMTQCPKCSDPLSVTIAGDELDIAYLEVEEP